MSNVACRNGPRCKFLAQNRCKFFHGGPTGKPAQCQNGPECEYLATSSCRFYHPPSHYLNDEDKSEEYSESVQSYCRASAYPPAVSTKPNKVILYHGTSGKNLQGIVSNQGLKISPRGRMGAGVYFTTDIELAWKVARDRGDEEYEMMLTCEVDLGKVYDFDADGRSTNWQSRGFDCAKGLHGPWLGHPSFVEYCVADEKCVRIIYV